MAERKELNFELIRALLEEAGLSAIDVISRLVELRACTGAGCSASCFTCKAGCSGGPAARSSDFIDISTELEQFKREILAELKGVPRAQHGAA